MYQNQTRFAMFSLNNKRVEYSVICINTHITVLAGRDNIVCTQGEKKKQIQEWFPVERLLK